MSIASEINRISTNVGDALTAIHNKGVTIPSGSNSDDLADLIGQIQQNGSAITITDETDAAGGVHRIITGVTLTGDTVQPGNLATGITAHNALGQAITGTATLHDSTNPIDWMGANPVNLGKVYGKEWLLKDTGFNTWTPTSTATSIVATEDGTTKALNFNNYEYWLVWSWEYTPVFNSGATMKAQITRQYGKIYNFVGWRPYGYPNFETMVDNRGYASGLYTSANYVNYYNTSGAKTWTSGLSYGIYPSNTASTLSSASSTTPTLTPKSPAVYARCSSTYMSTTRATEINKDESKFVIRGDLYQVDRRTAAGFQFYREACDIYNHPVTII